MRLNTMAKVATTAALLGAVSAGVATPASAADAGAAATTIYWGSNFAASFDNNPGNGSESWLWGWTSENYDHRIDYQHYDGTSGSMWIGKNSATSVNLNKDIWRVRGCWFDERVMAWGCHGWS